MIWRIVIGWICVTGAAYAALVLTTFLVLRPEARGALPLDMHVFGFTVVEAHDYLSGLTERGRAIQLGWLRLLDTVFVVGLTATLGGVIWTLMRRGNMIARFLLLVPVGGYAVMDLGENALIAQIIRDGANALDAHLVTRAAEFTITKFTLLGVSLTEAFVLMVVGLIGSARRR